MSTTLSSPVTETIFLLKNLEKSTAEARTQLNGYLAAPLDAYFAGKVANENDFETRRDWAAFRSSSNYTVEGDSVVVIAKQYGQTIRHSVLLDTLLR